MPALVIRAKARVQLHVVTWQAVVAAVAAAVQTVVTIITDS
eukprot:COSAG01_NODE_50433_length_363_cov_1.170455_1_plen_40_part_10